MNGKNVDLYVTTGTGNTLLCARALAGVFTANGYKTEMKKIEAGFEENDSVLGIAVPVICLSAFPYVWRFIDSLPSGNGKEAFFMSTYGLKHHDLESPIGKALKKKGYKLLGAKNIYMPHNLFDRNKGNDFFAPVIEKGLNEAESFAKDLINGISSWKLGSLPAALKTRLNRTNWFWNKFRKKLVINCDVSKCIKCGRCIELCPVDNIYMQDHPKFKNICEICVRCVAFCPVHALDFKGREAAQYHALDYKDLS